MNHQDAKRFRNHENRYTKHADEFEALLLHELLDHFQMVSAVALTPNDRKALSLLLPNAAGDFEYALEHFHNQFSAF
ncbi:hypothetical protein Pan54_32030 [Rubinisphaera italica]|uniref:Uncharacterized protein n=1 Tax=Rubinisphaera italica TaxID=2527969 RepID=A0A5C5XJC0_9PLAN|nr:hypothetical protein Pan54_32030 [Rubinisphaera italica]